VYGHVAVFSWAALSQLERGFPISNEIIQIAEKWISNLYIKRSSSCTHKSRLFGNREIASRTRQLGTLLRAAKIGMQLNEHVDLPGEVVFRHACRMGLEGIVSERLGSATRRAAHATGSSSRPRRPRG
jgi:hypothetical protein